MRILLLGKTGLLGAAWLEFLAEQADVELATPGRPALDVTDFTALKEYIDDVKPEIVINCTGYNQVDQAELDINERKKAYRLNAEVPKQLAELAKESNFKLVQYSSDYVFNGQSERGHKEDAERQPINQYGKTKAAGEEFVEQSGAEYLLIRTAWLFGKNRPNFVSTMLELADRHQEVRVVNDQLGSPSYTKDVVKATWQLLQENAESGIYHLTNSGTATWYEFAKKIFAITGKNVSLIAVTSDEFSRPAPRPRNSVLVSSKGVQLPTWEAALQEYLTSIE